MRVGQAGHGGGGAIAAPFVVRVSVNAELPLLAGTVNALEVVVDV